MCTCNYLYCMVLFFEVESAYNENLIESAVYLRRRAPIGVPARRAPPRAASSPRRLIVVWTCSIFGVLACMPRRSACVPCASKSVSQFRRDQARVYDRAMVIANWIGGV